VGANIMAAIAGGVSESTFEGATTVGMTGLLSGTGSGFLRWSMQQAAEVGPQLIRDSSNLFLGGDIPQGPGWDFVPQSGLGDDPFGLDQFDPRRIVAAAEEAARIATDNAVIACTPPG